MRVITARELLIPVSRELAAQPAVAGAAAPQLDRSTDATGWLLALPAAARVEVPVGTRAEAVVQVVRHLPGALRERFYDIWNGQPGRPDTQSVLAVVQALIEDPVAALPMQAPTAAAKPVIDGYRDADAKKALTALLPAGDPPPRPTAGHAPRNPSSGPKRS